MLHLDLELIERKLELAPVLEKLEGALQLLVGVTARKFVFIHAGVVAWKGRALLLPGRSLAGKSTLVHQLVAAGATYYSDEYAVLDAQGLIHPYRRPLSLRSPQRRLQIPPQLTPPIPLGAVVSTSFAPESKQPLLRKTSSEGGLALFENALAASVRPEEVLRHIAACLRPDVKYFQGERGEAAAFSQELLKLL